MTRESFIVFAKRSPVGRYRGSLKTLRADDMLAQVLGNLKDFIQFQHIEINDCIIGCANQAGEDNRNVARMGLLLAGFEKSVPGVTINRLCASSLDALSHASARIEAGHGDCYIVGGVENMSRAPYVLGKAEFAYDKNQKLYDTALGWRFPNSKMRELFPLYSMGETAEEIGLEKKIERSRQDEFALSSHTKALKAQEENLFENEMIPLIYMDGKKEFKLNKDEGPRQDTNLEKLASLKAVFREGGTVTAGNSSSLNDGASVALIVSGEFVKRHNLTPMARVIASSHAGLHPNVMGLGPIYATQKMLDRGQVKISELDLIEINEAFAIQALAFTDHFNVDLSKVNPWGGAISLGHALGNSGTRILATAINQMQRKKSIKKALLTMCIGVGQGLAVAIENC